MLQNFTEKILKLAYSYAQWIVSRVIVKLLFMSTKFEYSKTNFLWMDVGVDYAKNKMSLAVLNCSYQIL